MWVRYSPYWPQPFLFRQAMARKDYYDHMPSFSEWMIPGTVDPND